MNARILTKERLQEFAQWLQQEERSPGTVEKYLRDTAGFAGWLNGRAVTKELAAAWKNDLQSRGYAPVTINSMLAAVNSFFRFAGWEDCRARFLKVQRRMFREQDRELKPSLSALGQAARQRQVTSSFGRLRDIKKGSRQ